MLADESIPLEKRVSVAMMVGYAEETAVHASTSSAPTTPRNSVDGSVPPNPLSTPRLLVELRQLSKRRAARGFVKLRAVAAVTGLLKRAAEREQQAAEAAAAPVYNSAFLGRWVQECMEADRLEAILKTQGYGWAVRKSGRTGK